MAEDKEPPKKTKAVTAKDCKGSPKSRAQVPGERASTTGVAKPQAEQATWRQELRASRIKFDDPTKQIFLLHLLEHGQKILACKHAGVSHQTFRNHVNNDPEFADLVTEAIRERGRKMVEQIENEAMSGHEETRYNKEGEVSSIITRYESGLRAMILKRYDAEYRDRNDININTGAGGVLVVPAGCTPEEWTTKAAKLKQKMLADGAIEAEVISSEISNVTR